MSAEKPNHIRQIGGLAAGTGLAAIAVGAIVARRANLSLRGWAVSKLAVPLLFRRSKNQDVAAFDAAIRQSRRIATPRPGRAVRARFDVTDRSVGAHPVIVLTPKPKRGNGHTRLLYIHGGAYVYDLTPPHWTVIGGLADRLHAVAHVPVYPLAPEHDWRTAHDMVTTLYHELVKEVGAGNVVVAGDSAGGGFALALVQALRDEGRPLPACLVLLAPWLDVTVSDPAQTALVERDAMLSIPTLRHAGKLWAGNLSPTDPRISPLFGKPDGLPPTAIFTGTDDVLNSDAHRYAERAAAAGFPVEMFEYHDMFHVWMAADIPEGRRALDQAAAFAGGSLNR